jgi:hypothetical protein
MSADLPTLLVEEIASGRRRQSNGGKPKAGTGLDGPALE